MSLQKHTPWAAWLDYALGQPFIAGHVPRSYLVFLLALKVVYVAAILKLDSIACHSSTLCFKYSDLETSFKVSKAREVLTAWSLRSTAAMSVSAGLHVFSAFLFCQFFIHGGLKAEEFFIALKWRTWERLGTATRATGRVFNGLYCAAHCIIAAILVSGNPKASNVQAAGALIVISLILLVLCATFLIVTFFIAIWARCTHRLPVAEDPETPVERLSTSLSPVHSSAPVHNDQQTHGSFKDTAQRVQAVSEGPECVRLHYPSFAKLDRCGPQLCLR